MAQGTLEPVAVVINHDPAGEVIAELHAARGRAFGDPQLAAAEDVADLEAFVDADVQDLEHGESAGIEGVELALLVLGKPSGVPGDPVQGAQSIAVEPAVGLVDQGHQSVDFGKARAVGGLLGAIESDRVALASCLPTRSRSLSSAVLPLAATDASAS